MITWRQKSFEKYDKTMEEGKLRQTPPRKGRKVGFLLKSYYSASLPAQTDTFGSGSSCPLYKSVHLKTALLKTNRTLRELTVQLIFLTTKIPPVQESVNK